MLNVRGTAGVESVFAESKGIRVNATRGVKAAFLVLLTMTGWTFLVRADDDYQGLSVGHPMSDFGLRRIDPADAELKKIVWLSDYVGPAGAKEPRKALLLNFFAVWCKPCLKELPILEQLQNKYADAGLQVVSVNFRAESEDLSETLKATAKIIRTNNLTFPVLFDRYTSRNQLIYMGSKAALPCNILISADGIVAARFQSSEGFNAAEVEQAVRKQLAAGKTL